MPPRPVPDRRRHHQLQQLRAGEAERRRPSELHQLPGSCSSWVWSFVRLFVLFVCNSLVCFADSSCCCYGDAKSSYLLPSSFPFFSFLSTQCALSCALSLVFAFDQAGEYSLNAASCEKCELGRYAPTAQENECLICGAGDHTNNATAATACTACDAGKYSEGEVVTCTSCPVAKFSLSRQSSCDVCAPGTYNNVIGAGACLLCAAGSYQPLSGSLECEFCPKGKSQAQTGLTSCDLCNTGKMWFSLMMMLGC